MRETKYDFPRQSSMTDFNKNMNEPLWIKKSFECANENVELEQQSEKKNDEWCNETSV